MAEDSSEKIDTTEKAEEDGSEKVDTAENANAAEEETPDMGVQLWEPEIQNDENNPAPSISTESLSGSDPVAEPEKKEEDDGAQADFSSSSGSMKFDVQGDSHSTSKLSTSSDGEKKGSIYGSEKRDETPESEEPNYSEYSGFVEHFADLSTCSNSMYSSEESEDAIPQRGNSVEQYTQQAHELVNVVIESALKHIMKEQLRRQTTMDELKVELSRGSTPVVSRPVCDNETIENIDWLTIEEFTVDRGTSKIEEFIKVRTWSSVLCLVKV